MRYGHSSSVERCDTRGVVISCNAMTMLLVSSGLPSVQADSAATGPTLEDVFWPTMSAVQSHLWPTREGVPSITDFNATAYISARFYSIRSSMLGERQFVKDGVAPLEDFTQAQFDRSFFELDPAEREAVLRKVETSPVGRYWLSLMVYYLFEALLADPVYGGNTDTIGWRWLGHQPGFPRPPSAYPYA